MKTRHTENSFVASTVHISFATSKMLGPDVAPELAHLVIFSKGEYGWWILAHPDMVMEQGTLPPDLWLLIQEAQELGCDWLMLDRDGSTYDDLPQYDWEEEARTRDTFKAKGTP